MNKIEAAFFKNYLATKFASMLEQPKYYQKCGLGSM